MESFAPYAQAWGLALHNTSSFPGSPACEWQWAGLPGSSPSSEPFPSKTFFSYVSPHIRPVLISRRMLTDMLPHLFHVAKDLSSIGGALRGCFLWPTECNLWALPAPLPPTPQGTDSFPAELTSLGAAAVCNPLLFLCVRAWMKASGAAESLCRSVCQSTVLTRNTMSICLKK